MIYLIYLIIGFFTILLTLYVCPNDKKLKFMNFYFYLITLLFWPCLYCAIIWEFLIGLIFKEKKQKIKK